MTENYLSYQTLLQDEWLVTNGLGGFASCTIGGAPTRRQHGLLVASLPAPLGRTVLLSYVADAIILSDGTEIPLSFIRKQGAAETPQIPLADFFLENGLPVWKYAFKGCILEKRILLVHKQNTMHITYEYLSGSETLHLKWRPYIDFRHSEFPVSHQKSTGYNILVSDKRYEIEWQGNPTLRLNPAAKASFTSEESIIEEVFYETEAARGYEFLGRVESPGYFTAPLAKEEKIAFSASAETWKTLLALTPAEAATVERLRRRRLLKMAHPISNSEIGAKMTLAADQFVITPSSREEDMVRLQAAGEEARSIIAGYPWFTDWGRDTMISLEGLTLATKRYQVAESILRTFAYYVHDGLIPNMFPDGEKKAVYNTADASLWFFHAVERYIAITEDRDILELVLPKFHEIIHWHIKGTHFGIRMDSDGLLLQGQENLQLTWMDAKVGDWVVTPRRGKAVEINALWYNALRLYESWTGKHSSLADQCFESFNKRFWYPKGGYLYDVVDGANNHDDHPREDTALRPNQLFAISLKYPVLEEDRWKEVLDAVTKTLLTPVGLRTLEPFHKDFKSSYNGDLRARDAAYHQGTVWPWLLGPYLDVWLKVYPDKITEAKELFRSLELHMDNYCEGTIGEIFDACDPYIARGCFAQAWSVAEFLRCFAKLHFKYDK